MSDKMFGIIQDEETNAGITLKTEAPNDILCSHYGCRHEECDCWIDFRMTVRRLLEEQKKGMTKTIIIATSGFDNIEAILRAWSVEFIGTKVAGLWIVSERSSVLSNLFSVWEVKTYQISIWDKIS